MTDTPPAPTNIWTKPAALLTVGLIAGASWALSKLSFHLFGDFSFFAGTFEGAERLIADAFTRGFLVKVFLIAFLFFVVRLKAIHMALASLFQPATRAGWQIAAITAIIQSTVLFLLYVQSPARIFEPTLFNAYTTAIAAIGPGLGEETIYRGVVIITLANAGFSKPFQILMSGGLFGLAHFSWSLAAADAGLLIMLSPVLGTFFLGCFLAWAFQASGYKLLPVLVAHGFINVIAEPWMALSFFG